MADTPHPCVPPVTDVEGLYWMTRFQPGFERDWEVWRWSPNGQCWWAHFISITPDHAAERGWRCMGVAIPPGRGDE